jgi:hypothetical protein
VEIDIAHLHLDRLAHRFNASAAEQRRGQNRKAKDTHAVKACTTSAKFAVARGSTAAIITASASVMGAAI